MEETLYYAHKPMMVGLLMLAQATRDLVVRDPEKPRRLDGKHPPKMFARQNDQGKFVWAYAFREPKAVATFVYENYNQTDLPLIDKEMNYFLKDVRESIRNHKEESNG